jgi:uncharacterized cupin superfamily protein
MTSATSLPIINFNDIDEADARYPDEQPGGRGFYRDPSRGLGMKHFGISLDTLYPGQENARYHAERGEDEFFFVLTGTCKVRLDGKIYQLHPGDVLFTPVGVAHSFFNDGADACSILMAGQTVEGSTCDYLPAPEGPVTTGRPPRCVNIGDIQPVPVQAEGEPVGSRGESVEVSAALGMTSLTCSIHRLLPGQQDSRFHFHKEEEAFFLILKGSPVLRYGSDSQITEPDDCIYVEPGKPHCFVNHTDKPALIFKLNTACGHPDSHDVEEKKR